MVKILLSFAIGFQLFVSFSITAQVPPTSTTVQHCRGYFGGPNPEFIDSPQACAMYRCKEYWGGQFHKWDGFCISAGYHSGPPAGDMGVFFKAYLCNPGCHTIDINNGVQTWYTPEPLCSDANNSFAVDTDDDGEVNQCWPTVSMPENIAEPNCSGQGSVANPVLISTAIKYESEIDYQSKRSKFKVERKYNSYDALWRFGWNYELEEVTTNHYKLTEPSGKVVNFINDGTGNFLAQTHSQYMLSNVGGLFFVSTGELLLIFNSSGALQSKVFRDGYQEDLQYAAGKISGVTNNRGESLTINYHPYDTNRIDSIVIGSTTLKYSWDVYDTEPLVKNIRLNGHIVLTYKYNRYGRLIEKLDASGQELASWSYDPVDKTRILSAEKNGKEAYEIITVSPTIKRIKNPLNKWTEYELVDVKNGLLKIAEVRGEASTNCEAANKFYSYDNNGYLRTQTDWKDSVTYYEYDSQGRQTLKRQGYRWQNDTPKSGVVSNVLSFLDAPSNPSNLIETVTCWHSTLNQPERIIENDRVTIYDYFTSGQLKTNKIEPRNASNETCQ